MHKLVAAALVTAIAAFAVPRPAAADTGHTSSLSWVELPGAESCGGARSIAGDVEERLGRRALVSPSQADLSIEARVERATDARSWHAAIVLRDSRGAVIGTREIDAVGLDCRDLRSDAALAIALMIDPDAVAAPRPEAAAPPRSAAPEDAADRVPARSPDAAAPSWHVETTIAAGGSAGLLPAAAPGLVGGITVVPPHFPAIEAFGEAWASESVADANTSFTAALGGLGVCPLRLGAQTRLVFQTCLGGKLGALSGTITSGQPVVRQGAAFLLAAYADAHLAFRLAGPMWARVGAGFVPLLAHGSYVIGQDGGTRPVFEPSVLTATADLGIAVELP